MNDVIVNVDILLRKIKRNVIVEQKLNEYPNTNLPSFTIYHIAMKDKIEKIIKDINKAMPAMCDKKVQKDIDNTYREILTKHLKTTEDICLRC